MIVKKLFLYFIILAGLNACAGSGDQFMLKKMSARLILSSMDCGVSTEGPGLSVLSSRKELDEAMVRITRLTGHDFSGQIDVSFDREQIMRINMGQQRTGGYSLTLIAEQAIVKDGWAIIPVQWNTPAKDRMLIQVLTSPCLFVAIPRADYEGIRVVDQDGSVRLQSPLN